MLEHVIEVTMVLFILSMSSEKLVELIKLNSWFDQSLQERKISQTEEDRRRKRIIWISFIVCLIISVSSDASIFDLFKSQPVSGHFEKLSYFDSWHDLIGYVITAFFLSLGSTFWHDLLDILLEVKLSKRKLSEESTFRATSADQLKLLISIPDQDFIDKAYLENRDKWLTYPNIHRVGIEYIGEGTMAQPILSVGGASKEALLKVDDNVTTEVNGIRRVVKVHKKVVQQAEAQVVLAGDGIRNICKSGAGTLGCEVIDLGQPGKRFALTCFHVVRFGHNLSFFSRVSGDCNGIISEKNSEDRLGDIFWGVLTDELDIAIIECNENVTNELTDIPNIGRISDFKRLSPSDHLTKPFVRFLGRNGSNVKFGRVTARNESVSIKYNFEDLKEKTLHGLLGIQGFDNKPISDFGDSGALLVDNDNFAVGIIVAKDSEKSYAIPFSSINDQTSIRLLSPVNSSIS